SRLPLYNECDVAWKTLSEHMIIFTSAGIRNSSGWTDKLESEAAREQWITDMKSECGLTDKQAAYVISELFYYKKLQSFVENSGSDAKLSVADIVWYTDIPKDSDLAQFNISLSKMLKTMPKDHYYRLVLDNKNKQLAEQIVDPTLYSLVYKSTPILSKPMTCPMEALNLCSFGTVPGSIDAWKQAICNLNASMAKKDNEDNSEQLNTAANGFVPFNEEYLGLIDPGERHWLPTDIYVNDDGSVDFKSYINNIHPEEHADMYKAIAKILSKTIPLLEQALTDWEHPRDLRVPYNYYYCLKFPEEFPSDPDNGEYYDYQFYTNYEKWRKTIINTTLYPDEFVEPERPLAAYSLFPPQQKDWWTKSVSSVPSRISTLPLEIQDMVFKYVDIPMSFERAFIQEIISIVAKPQSDCLVFWKTTLPLLAICNAWRDAAKPIIYSKAFIETEEMGDAGQHSTHRSQLLDGVLNSNIGIIASVSSTQFVKHIEIDIKTFGSLQALACGKDLEHHLRTNDWTGAISLKVKLAVKHIAYDADSVYTEKLHQYLKTFCNTMVEQMPNIANHAAYFQTIA
ncbi:hypothetical protein LPJ64_006185, partial [Coemansia asiatica]